MLARTATAEVIARDQQFCSGRFRLIERKVGAWLSIRPIAPVGEQRIAQSFFIRHLQIACWNDPIRIDIGDRYGHCLGRECCNWFYRHL